jgi:hypothetical protein
MVADAFKLLPKESETKRRWNTVEWAKERKGWVFLTSKPTMRERMRPLISLWLDLLVLRLMNEESTQAQDVVRAGRAGQLAAVSRSSRRR